MKKFAVHFGFAVALVCAASTISAQSADVTGGSLTISVGPALNALLQAQGVTGSSYTPSLSGTRVPFLPAQAGVFDLATGSGSFTTGGVLVFTSGATKLKIMNMAFETDGPYPVVTGSMYLNNHFVCRGVVLDMMTSNPMHAPFAAAPMLVHEIPAELSPNLAGALANAFKVTVPPSTLAATLTVNIGLVADALQ